MSLMFGLDIDVTAGNPASKPDTFFKLFTLTFKIILIDYLTGDLYGDTHALIVISSADEAALWHLGETAFFCVCGWFVVKTLFD